MMDQRSKWRWVLFFLMLPIAGQSYGGTVKGRMELTNFDLANQLAHFDVTAIFEEAGEVAGISINITASQAPSGNPITDFSNFTFTPSLFPTGRLQPTWNEFSTFGPGNGHYTLADPFIPLTPPATTLVTTNDSLFLGELTFDFGAEGLIGGDSFIVDVIASTVLYRQSGIPIGGVVTLEFDDPLADGSQELTIPASPSGIVPEPSSILAMLGVLGIAVAQVRRKRKISQATK